MRKTLLGVSMLVLCVVLLVGSTPGGPASSAGPLYGLSQATSGTQFSFPNAAARDGVVRKIGYNDKGVWICCSGAAAPTYPSPRLNETWRMGAHNAFWHGTIMDTEGSGPKQHLLDSVYIDRVRALELDLHSFRASSPGNWHVYHTYDMGYSLCRLLDDCLKVIRAFHYGNPNHDVFFIHLEAKETGFDTLFDFDDPIKLKLMPDNLDQTLTAYLGPAIFGPADYYRWCQYRIDRGELSVGTTLDRTNLKDAVKKCGWPTMAELRGKFILTLHGSYRDNEAYVWAYSHMEGKPIDLSGSTIDRRKIFPMASVQGSLGVGFCLDKNRETFKGICNWGKHSVFADVLTVDDFYVYAGPSRIHFTAIPGMLDEFPFFGLEPRQLIRQFILDGGLVRVNDRNSRVNFSNNSDGVIDAVSTVHGLPDVPGANFIPTDAPRNMLVNYEWASLANPTPVDNPLNWSVGCLFEPNSQGRDYFHGCSPDALKEENSGIFVRATNATDGLIDLLVPGGQGHPSDRIVFVHMPRRSGAGSFKAFVSTRTDELRYGPTYTGNMGCLMARADLSPGSPFFAVCRRRHRNNWDSKEDGAYLLYRTTASTPSTPQYYDYPKMDFAGVAEIQNFFRLDHNADGKCWKGYIQATDDPAPSPGWGPILLHGDICFSVPLNFIGLAMDGGWREDPTGPILKGGRGDYLFANIRYNGATMTRADLGGTSVIPPGAIPPPTVEDRSFKRNNCSVCGSASDGSR